jgi:hypothetical protein
MKSFLIFLSSIPFAKILIRSGCLGRDRGKGREERFNRGCDIRGTYVLEFFYFFFFLLYLFGAGPMIFTSILN